MQLILYTAWRKGYKIPKIKEYWPQTAHLTDKELCILFGEMVRVMIK